MSDRLPAISLHEQLRLRRPRVYVTGTLIAANVLVFLAMYASGAKLGLSPSEIHLKWGASFGPATQDGEWWRLASAMFLHFGVLHLAMNSWALWDGGQLVERMAGPVRFAAIYLVSGVAGNLLSLDVSRVNVVTGGASGAIFGIYGALLVYLWQERLRLDSREFRWLFWGALAFSCVAVALGFVVTGIDNAAHIGGLVVGMLCGLFLLPASDRSGRLRAGGAAVLLALMWAALVAGIPAPAYRWRDEAGLRVEIAQFMKSEAAVKQAWAEILGGGEQRSFEEIAGQIETRIADSYERSFEHLSQLAVSPGLPSAPDLERLRSYASAKRDATQRIADALRENDPSAFREASGRARNPATRTMPESSK